MRSRILTLYNVEMAVVVPSASLVRFVFRRPPGRYDPADTHDYCAANGSPLRHIGQSGLFVGRLVVDGARTRRIPM